MGKMKYFVVRLDVKSVADGGKMKYFVLDVNFVYNVVAEGKMKYLVVCLKSVAEKFGKMKYFLFNVKPVEDGCKTRCRLIMKKLQMD